MNLRLLAFLVSSLASGSLLADEILAAVASNFTAPMNALVADFEAESGHDVQVAYGSSGRFYAQVVNGAPYQIFLSADQEKPQLLEEAGIAVPGTRFTYAVGTLALWSATTAVAGVDALRQSFTRLAIANPTLAPYGQAAVEVLENLDLVHSTNSRWVLGENIAQTYQFVATGNAQLGFVSLSQLIAGGSLTEKNVWVVPGEFHSTIAQDAVLLRHGEDCAACREFLQFLQSDETKVRLGAYGYGE